MYEKFFKRLLDFLLSTTAFLILSPLLLLLTISGAIAMKGNPFYIQKRPGMRDKKTGKERIIRLYKFRSMSNAKDKDGKLLQDKNRLNRYGRLLRATSLDELPSLVNIVTGDLAIVGPRPLAMIYLPYYTEEERRRHDVRPGLTGLAQVNGRNNLSWEEKFSYDLQYAAHITFPGDLRIILKTAGKVFIHEGIGQGEQTPVSLHVERADWVLTENGAVKPAPSTAGEK